MNLDKTLEIIYNKLDPWLMEDPTKTKDQIFKCIVDDIKARVAFPIEKNGMVFYLMPETKQRARLHLFSDTHDIKTTIESAKWLTSFAFCNIKSLEKMYGITPHKKFLRVIHKFGWKHEGILTHSFYSKSGIMKDQIIFGVSRSDYTMSLQPEQNAHTQN